MASDFLKNMAQRQAEKIDKEYGSDAYGGSNWRQQQAAGGGTTAQAQQVSGRQVPSCAPRPKRPGSAWTRNTDLTLTAEATTSSA